MHTPVRPLLLAAVSSLVLGSLPLAAEPAAVPPPSADAAVGLSSRDGISISGADVLVTRNGVTEKMTKETSLPNGVKIMPDGTVVGTDGSKVLLRPGQVVTFDGKLLNAPVVEAVPPGRTGLAPAPAK